MPQVKEVAKDVPNKDKTKGKFAKGMTKNMEKNAKAAKSELQKVKKKSGTADKPEVDKVRKAGAKAKAEKPEGKTAKGSVAEKPGSKKQPKLTEKTLQSHDNSQHGELTLDEKLQLMKEKGKDAVSLSGADFTRLNLRFTQTALAKLDPEIQQAWADASHGRGKVHKQHEILMVFAEDPKAGKHFLNRIQEVIQNKKVSTQSEWVSRKKLLADIDESEAEEMIQDGTLLVRKNPLNPRRLQYKSVTTTETEEQVKVKRISGVSNLEVTGDKMVGVMNKINNLKIRGGKQKVFSESSDEEELPGKKNRKDVVGGIPKDPKEPKDPAKKKIKLDQQSIDAIEEDDDEAVHELSQKLSSNMNSVVLSIKSLKLQFEHTMYATPAKLKDINNLIGQCENAKKKIDLVLVKNSATLKILKGAWDVYTATKSELSKLERIVQMEETCSTTRYSAKGKH